ncbi:MAG: NUDIX domain-containing protein, partial [Thermoplasmata archaeon]
FPGYWSVVMGGHVTSGDSYDETLKKEMEEEIGTLGEYTELGEFIKDIPEEVEYVKLYKVTVSPDDIELLEEEFQRGEYWTLDKIKKEKGKRKFLPETDIVLKYISD